MSNSDEFDFHRVCRTCLSSENLQLLFGQYLQHARIDDMLTLCTSVKYNENDGLPVQICGDCIVELKRSYTFALKCRQTDDKLRMYKQKLVPQIYATPNYLNATYKRKSLLKPLSLFEINEHTDIDVMLANADISFKAELDAVTQENICDTEDQCSSGIPMLPEKTESQKREAYPSNKSVHKNRSQNRQINAESKVIEIPISCIPIISESQLISLDYKRTYNSTDTTQIKPYSCVVCVKSFSQQHDLTRHVRTHTGEKPYTCAMCNKQFNRKTNLNMHMRVHTVTKQYSCTTCYTSFNRQQCLLRHLCKHTGEKPYPCTVCDKSFNQSHDLKRHLRTHTGEKPYTCTVCSRSFTRKTYLRIHLQKHHSR